MGTQQDVLAIKIVMTADIIAPDGASIPPTVLRPVAFT